MNRLLLLFCLSALMILSCKDDILDFDYDPGRLHFDGVNANAPFLPAGTTQPAARFSDKILDLYDGKEISAVELFIYDIPESCTLVFYGDGSKNAPGEILLEKDITAELDTFKWNTVALDAPFQIPKSGDLWIGLRVENSEATQVIGCDAGPTKEGGDWLYQSNDGEWKTFRDRSPDRINWNIRAVVD